MSEMMHEVGVEGDLFNTHERNDHCTVAGCVPVVKRLPSFDQELDNYRRAWRVAESMFTTHPEFCRAKGKQYRPCGTCTIDALAKNYNLPRDHG